MLNLWHMDSVKMSMIHDCGSNPCIHHVQYMYIYHLYMHETLPNPNNNDAINTPIYQISMAYYSFS